MTLFLTGSTGNVGLELVRQLLRRSSSDRSEAPLEVRLLIRAKSDDDLAARWRWLLSLASDGRLTPAAVPWARPVRGDVTLPALGLGASDLQWLRDEATHVLHAAALVDFNADRAQVWPINVDGTRHVIELAHQMTRLEAFGHVSTLYVAGKRVGFVGEDDFEHDEGFVNAYEESKYEAERLMRAAMLVLPASIYRLSLLIGRQSDGYVHQCFEAHKMFELFLSGRTPRLLGAPANTLDMLPTDYAADQLARLFVDRFEAGRTWQIAAGAAAPTGADLVDAFRVYLARPEWDIDWIDAAEWAEICAHGDGAAHRLSASAQWMFEVLGDYMLRPKLYSRAALDGTLRDDRSPAPRLVDYLPRILGRCVADDWGRTRTAEAAR